MRLVGDASVLVAELLRSRGRALIAHPFIDLVLAAETYGETAHELRKRAAQLAGYGHMQADAAAHVASDALATIVARVALAPSDIYADYMEEARRRIPRDSRDAPVVALALALNWRPSPSCGRHGAQSHDLDPFGLRRRIGG